MSKWKTEREIGTTSRKDVTSKDVRNKGRKRKKKRLR
jgi:hypothetical protein